MIAAKKLRLGNWLNVKAFSKDQFTTVTSIGAERILGKQFYNVLDGGEHPISSEELHPIPLTAQILEKTGFSSSNDYWTGAAIVLTGPTT